MATGTVKWFNPTKGYGFIQPDEGGPDAFVHITALEQSNIDTLNEGAKVTFELEVGRNGKQAATNLKLISRVGIGLDSVDLLAAKERGIEVTYTPDAPAPAVAELTLGLMLSLLRSVHVSNFKMHDGEWHRFFGRRLAEVTIGIIGVGRIGSRVLNRTKGFGTPRILVNDVMPNLELDRKFKLEWVSRERIYKEADIISIHLPLTHKTKNMILKKHLLEMKKDAIFINSARGGIINEQDLYEVMKSGHL